MSRCLHFQRRASFTLSHGRLRDLHSFPTRRSSDLAMAPPPVCKAPRGRADGEDTDPDAWSPDTYVSPRSEEHTSELQSRGHLVCRLLLEKKKYRKVPYTRNQDSSH